MKRYNLFYKAGNRRIEKNNLTREEVYEFLNSLGKEEESELRVVQVKDREEEEGR